MYCVKFCFYAFSCALYLQYTLYIVYNSRNIIMTQYVLLAVMRQMGKVK